MRVRSLHHRVSSEQDDFANGTFSEQRVLDVAMVSEYVDRFNRGCEETGGEGRKQQRTSCEKNN